MRLLKQNDCNSVTTRTTLYYIVIFIDKPITKTQHIFVLTQTVYNTLKKQQYKAN